MPQRLEKTRLIPAAVLRKVLAVSRAHVYVMEQNGSIPRAIRIGRLMRWDRSEIESWMDAGCPARDEWEAIRNRVRASELPIGNQTGGAP